MKKKSFFFPCKLFYLFDLVNKIDEFQHSFSIHLHIGLLKHRSIKGLTVKLYVGTKQTLNVFDKNALYRN